MKFSLLAAGLLISLSGMSQIQLRISGEYGAGLQRDFIHNVAEDGTISTQKGSYGTGVFVNFGAGWGFSNTATASLDVTVQSGVTYQQNTIGSNGRTMNTVSSQGSYVAFTPNLTIRTDGNGVKPYLRVGPMIAFPNVTENRSYTNAPEGNDIFKYKGGTAFGMYGAIGLELFSGDGAVLFVEMVSRNLTYHPKRLENTSTFTGQQAESIKSFKDKPGNADELLTVSKSFSTIGGAIGIKLNIGTKKKKVLY